MMLDGCSSYAAADSPSAQSYASSSHNALLVQQRVLYIMAAAAAKAG
jgi:hypothetical protein